MQENKTCEYGFKKIHSKSVIAKKMFLKKVNNKRVRELDLSFIEKTGTTNR